MAIPNSRQAQFSSKVNEAVEAGEKFIKVFYESIDKRRQVENYYSIWNAPSMSDGHVGALSLSGHVRLILRGISCNMER